MVLTTNDFRANPLSDKIINALIESTQTYAEMNVILNEYPEFWPALSDILLYIDVYNCFYDTQPDICQIVHSMYISSETTFIASTINTIAVCLDYTQCKVRKADVLTAGDLLKNR